MVPQKPTSLTFNTLLDRRWISLGYAVFALVLLLLAPPAELLPSLSSWTLRAAAVGLISLVLYRALSAEEGLRMRAQRRERVLHDFLVLSNRLRVTNNPRVVLEEVAQAVQASGE